MPMPEKADVVIVGAGPAGSALAIRLAQIGVSVIVLERSTKPEWRACGVFSSPLTNRRLRDLGLPASVLTRLSRPISALNLETTRGVKCRIEYEHGHARGFDRPVLDDMLLERARQAGADVRTGVAIRELRLPAGRRDPGSVKVSPTVASAGGRNHEIRAALVVGADGATSIVAGKAGVISPRVIRLAKAASTAQRRDDEALDEGQPMEGRFVFGKRWYVGVAPVPHRRVNLGLVHPGSWAGRPPERVEKALVARFPGPRQPWMDGAITEPYRSAGILQHGVSRTVGDGFLLVGDAAGFIDPLTGEGLHRALVSSDLAAESIAEWLHGNRNALAVYDRRLRSRFAAKDVVSWVLQGFLSQPRLMEYALQRLARRTDQRRTLTLVLTDQVPATRALDPRFLARLLAP
jgi:geranylgeranyl reductase family protein